MIRNYNGNVNRTLLRGLKKLCMVNAEDEKNLSNAYAKDGKVSFYENTDFFGLPDEMSELITLESQNEINDYLKKNLEKKLELFLHGKDTTSDYLLTSVISFIKEKGYFPIADEMRKLECEAESKRLIDFPVDLTAIMPSTKQNMLKEVMELCEEIFESRKSSNSKDIELHVEPYWDQLSITSDNFYVTISWDRHYGQGNNNDYRLSVRFKGDSDICVASFQSYGSEMYIISKDWCEKDIDLSVDHLIAIHQDICKIAEEEGIEFLTEIDYEKLKDAT